MPIREHSSLYLRLKMETMLIIWYRQIWACQIFVSGFTSCKFLISEEKQKRVMKMDGGTSWAAEVVASALNCEWIRHYWRNVTYFLTNFLRSFEIFVVLRSCHQCLLVSALTCDQNRKTINGNYKNVEGV